MPAASDAAMPRSPAFAHGPRRGALGQVGRLEYLCLAVLAIAFVLLNAPGSSTRLIASAAILVMVAVGVVALLSRSRGVLGASRGNGGALAYYPAVAFALSLLAFHFCWGAGTCPEWLSHVRDDGPVAYALLLAAAAILAVAGGAVLAGTARPSTALSAAPGRGASGQAAAAASLVAVGLASWLWALRNGYAGFAASAFGLGQAAVDAPLTPTILALYSLLGVGQTALLVLLLSDLHADRPRLGRIMRLVLAIAFVAAFGLDMVFRLQSAARGTMLAGLIPLFVTAHAFGYRRALVAASIAAIAGYVLVVYPLGDAMRYDRDYGRQVAGGGLFVPEAAYVWDVISDTASSSDPSSRLNQTSLLAFAVERQGDGLAPLSGESYTNALATLVPRVLVADRVDTQIEYDYYTGYATVFRGYNNWGVHTEAYLNFGWVGVIALMAALGYAWQKVYCLLTRFAHPFGWAIVAAVLLPTIVRAGEYNFLATIVSPTKTLLLVVVCSWGALALARWALSAKRR